MKKLLNLLLAVLAIFGVACNPNNGENNNGGGDGSKLTLRIEISSVTATNASILVYPSNYDDGYYFDVIEKTAYNQYESDDILANEVVAGLKEQYGADISLADRYQNEGWNFDNLTPNTEYYVFASGVTATGEITTGVKKREFKTLTEEEMWGDDVADGINKGNTTITDLSWGGYSNIGEFYKKGVLTWMISLNTELGNSLTFYLFSDLSATEPVVGTYELNRTLDAGTALIGGVNYMGYNYGATWVAYDANGEIIEMVLCKSGTITLGKEGNNFVIALNAIDEYGNTVTASYNGALDNYTQDLESLAK
jgi:hypothetical protein